MKSILFTGHNDNYKSLAKITVPRMAEYADMHSLDFTCYDKPLIDVPNGIYWTGVCGALKAFEEGYDKVMYLDVDQLITNQETPPNAFPDGFHASKDWGNDAIEEWQFSMCGFIAHRVCVPMFQSVLDVEPEWRDKPFPEQGPFQHIVKERLEELEKARIQLGEDQIRYYIPKVGRLIRIWPRKVFNCVPDQIAPGNVPEPWTKGDFAAHLTMVDLPRRIEIANEILASL